MPTGGKGSVEVKKGRQVEEVPVSLPQQVEVPVLPEGEETDTTNNSLQSLKMLQHLLLFLTIYS